MDSVFSFTLLIGTNQCIHVEYADGLAKFWLEPVVLESFYRLKPKDIKKAKRIIKENRSFMKGKWNEYFSKKY